jgi:hypothetical protein
MNGATGEGTEKHSFFCDLGVIFKKIGNFLFDFCKKLPISIFLNYFFLLKA